MASKKDRLRQQVIALRKDNLSIYDISRVLEQEEEKLSLVGVSVILKEEGFARLPGSKVIPPRPPTPCVRSWP